MQRYVEYFTVVERMNRNLPLRNKLSEIDDDLKVCRNKGFMTEEVTAIKQKVNKLKELYSKSEEFFKFKKSFNVKQLCQNYKSVTNNMFEEGSLLEYLKDSF